MNYQDLADRLANIEAMLLGLTEEWRGSGLEGKDSTTVESALFQAAQKVGAGRQRLQVLSDEAAAREREQPSLRFAEGGA